MTIYIPIPLIIIAIAIGTFIFVEINYPESPTWNKVKTALQFVFLGPIMLVPMTGVYLGVLIGKKVGWGKDSFKTQILSMVLSICSILAVLKVLKELNIF